MNLKIDTVKLKDARGRITGYRSSYSEVSGEGPTPQASVMDLNYKLTEASKAHHTRIRTFAGHVLVVSYSCFSWQYNIIWPEHLAADKSLFSSVSGFDSSDDAMRAAKLHLAAQLLPDLRAFEIADSRDHDELIRRQVAQAEYLERHEQAMAHGLTENQAHLYALRAPGTPETL